jgi:hypothetical protein
MSLEGTIGGFNAGSDKSNGKGKHSGHQGRTNEKKRELPTYKYSNMGKGDLHESIVLDGVPVFIKYDFENKQIKIIDRIEHETRILIPPSHEEYPYIPYEFTKQELVNYIQLASAESIDTIYQKALSLVKRYNDQDGYKQNLIALDIVWSYSQDRFSTTHYQNVVGDNDSGKSTIGATFEVLSYRCVNTTNPSAANVFRILGTVEPGQCTLVCDESRNMDESEDMMAILSTGYDYSKKVPKTNTNTWKQEFFFTYGLKLIIGENSLNQYKARGVLDRTLQYTTYPGDPQSDIKEVMNPQGDPLRKKELEDLMHFRKLMLIYRLIHHMDVIPDIDIGIKRRNRELCKPYIQLFYGSAAQHEIEETLQKFLNSKNSRKSTSQESVLLPMILGLIASNHSTTILVSTIWDKIINTLEGRFDESGAFHTSDWKLYKNTITKLMCDKFGATKVHTSKGSVLTFDPCKLAKINRSYNTEIKIKTTLKPYAENEGDITSETSRDATPENGGDGCDGYDGSRDTAHDVNDNNSIVITASNQPESNTEIIEEGLCTTSGAIIAVTAVRLETGNNPINKQVSIPITADIQPSSETSRNAGEIYWSGTNWYCRECKLYGDKFYMEVHVCKGYVPI